MSRHLYKVKVETDIMVMALDKREAEEIAKKNAPNEVGEYGQFSSSIVKAISDVPYDWRDIIPYGPDSVTQETRKCKDLIGHLKEQNGNEDLEELVRIQKNSKKDVRTTKEQVDEVLPPTRPDPKPRELDWSETKSGRPLPHLKFNIPKK